MSACRELRARIRGLARLRWLAAMGSGATVCVGTIAGLLLLLLSADHVLDLPPALRLLGLLLWLGVAAAVLVLQLLRPALQGIRVEAAAQQVERLCGLRDNRILNACQFAGRQLDPDGLALAEAIAADGARSLDRLDRQAFLGLRGLVNGLLFLALLALAWGAYAASYPHQLRHSLGRLLYPLEPSGEIGDAVIAVRQTGPLRRYAGDAVTLDASVTVIRGEHPLIEPQLVVGERGAAPESGERLAMGLTADGFRGVARDLRRDRVLWVEALGARSAPITLRILPPPSASGIAFSVIAPDYAGGRRQELPGPTLDLLADSRLRISARIDGATAGLRLIAGGADVPLERAADGSWSAEAVVRESGSWQLCSTIPEALRDPSGEPQLVLATGSLRIAADRAPQVRIDVTERNRFLPPGARLRLPVVASDDLGLQSLELTAADSVDEADVSLLRRWPYLGPPGRSGELRETLEVELDPRRFAPGRSYILRALARDFRPPAGQITRSEPIVIRIMEPEQLRPGGDGASQQAVASLKQAIAAQDQARGRTAQVRANRPPAGEAMQPAAAALAEAQQRASELIAQAAEQFGASGGGERSATELARLRRGDGALAARWIEALPRRSAQDLDAALTLLRLGQDELYARLVALLGRIAAEGGPGAAAEAPGEPRSLVDEFADGLDQLLREQRQILERARSVGQSAVAGEASDLTLEQEATLGQLARRQDELVRFLEDGEDTLARIPQLAERSREAASAIQQELRLAADALYRQQPASALPHGQAGLELAETLRQQLEGWLAAATADGGWSAESAGGQAGGVSGLPRELDDLVGRLLDDLAAMDPALQAAAPSPLDQPAAIPAPVEAGTASTLVRLPSGGGTPSAADAAAAAARQGGPGDTSPGSATDPALEDPQTPSAPPELRQRMQRLAEQQAGIRKQAAELALELRRRGYPSGDLEAAVAALQGVAAAATRGDAVSLRQAHHSAVDALAVARREIATEARVRREHAIIPEHEREFTLERIRPQIPAGYETMVELYYQALQGRRQP